MSDGLFSCSKTEVSTIRVIAITGILWIAVCVCVRERDRGQSSVTIKTAKIMSELLASLLIYLFIPV